MKIKRSSWHSKISNLGNDWERANDNLCCYFWRLVGKSALIFVTTFLICFLIYEYFTSNQLILHTMILLWLGFTFALPPLAIWSIRKKLNKSPEMPYENIVVEYMATKKRKICPLIEYI